MTAFALLLPVYLVPLSDGMRLPPVEYLRGGCEFNLRYQAHLRDLAAGFPHHRAAAEAALAAARWHHRVWDDAWYVRDATYPEATRRAALVRLVGAIGWRAYRRAELPPCVPGRYFGLLGE